ncbi:MAG: AAA family ATPase [Ignavibacterium sp.]|nr:AAA family ATPase [Ignavibacterium sp.]
MKLTSEQYDIINSTGDIKINAVAGSGKTTTIIEYSKSRPKKSKILYLAFNRSVKKEAEEKFLKLGLDNVKVETAHSLAYKNVMFNFNYSLKNQGYKTYEVADILKIKKKREKHFELLAANHINKFVNYFCNSDVRKVQQLNYLEIVSDPIAKDFVNKHYDLIENYTRIFLKKMDSGEIEITHDFYLKKFQLLNPILNYDYILFDEGQDASTSMLDVFLNQKATKVIVGDSHQQIYSWRYAINSLEKVDFKSFPLTSSFRFNQDIANLSMEILKLKNLLNNQIILPIRGLGKKVSNNFNATLARTNLGLLSKAFDLITNENKNISLYFEGKFNSYLYADDGASIFDVLNLYNQNYDSIKDNIIRSMNNFTELEEYANKTEDTQLLMLIEIVKKYGDELPKLVKLIKDNSVDYKKDADMIFSTVHRAKGMEYKNVYLHNDFITERKIKKLINNQNEKPIDLPKIFEEINILYVAITRVIKNLFIPQIYLPSYFPKTSSIKILTSYKDDFSLVSETNKDKKSISIKDKKSNSNFDKKWSKNDEIKLISYLNSNKSLNEISKLLGRTKAAIINRLNKLFEK